VGTTSLKGQSTTRPQKVKDIIGLRWSGAIRMGPELDSRGGGSAFPKKRSKWNKNQLNKENGRPVRLYAGYKNVHARDETKTVVLSNAHRKCRHRSGFDLSEKWRLKWPGMQQTKTMPNVRFLSFAWKPDLEAISFSILCHQWALSLSRNPHETRGLTWTKIKAGRQAVLKTKLTVLSLAAQERYLWLYLRQLLS